MSAPTVEQMAKLTALVEYLNEVADDQEISGKDEEGKLSHFGTGMHRGEALAFRFAAKWLTEILEDTAI